MANCVHTITRKRTLRLTNPRLCVAVTSNVVHTWSFSNIRPSAAKQSNAIKLHKTYTRFPRSLDGDCCELCGWCKQRREFMHTLDGNLRSKCDTEKEKRPLYALPRHMLCSSRWVRERGSHLCGNWSTMRQTENRTERTRLFGVHAAEKVICLIRLSETLGSFKVYITLWWRAS